jgi:hypothetical protein
MTEFTQALVELLDPTVKGDTKQEAERNKAQPDGSRAAPGVEEDDALELLRDKFAEKWMLTFKAPLLRLVLGKFFSLRIGNNRLKRSIDEFQECLAENPEPRFQVTCLVDLPPELLQYIMSVPDIDVSRLLGSTCRGLRSLSLPYIFRVSTYSVYLAVLKSSLRSVN